MKSFLFTYSQACTQFQAQTVLNDTQGVETWIAPFPNAAILVSRLNAQDLSAIIRDRIPGVWFILSEIDDHQVNGWLPGDFWEYVYNPQEVWQRKLFEGMRPTPPKVPKVR